MLCRISPVQGTGKEAKGEKIGFSVYRAIELTKNMDQIRIFYFRFNLFPDHCPSTKKDFHFYP
jgi:hypothetical protein